MRTMVATRSDPPYADSSGADPLRVPGDFVTGPSCDRSGSLR